MDPTPLLTVRALSKTFGGLRAVDRVDLELREGEILGVIGPNGAGKTTLFGLIAGSLRATSGEVWLGRWRVTGHPAHRVVRAGIVRTHQIVRPLNELTVRENVMAGACFGRMGYGLSDAAREADQVMALLGLAPRAEQIAASLNVAQKKRLELARALSAQPYLLLLDEVLAGLNPTEIAEMVQTIRAIRDRGITIFMIEHVMHALMNVSDRVIVLDYGEQIAEGTPAEVAANPKVIEAYLGDPKLAERLRIAD